MALPDLITLAYCQAELAAGGRALTSAQVSALPSKIAEASTAVRRWCGDRDFTRTTYTEDYRPALDGTVDLRQFPVNRVLRVSGGRSAGITIANTDRTTNVRATVGFTSTGDEAAGITWTGLALVRTAAGADIPATTTFFASPTLGLLAASVVALGGGWTATVPAGLAGWPSAELVGGDVAQDALGTGAELEVYAEVLAGCRVDRRTGVLSVGVGGGTRAVDGPAWGPCRDPDAGSWQVKVRVVYDGGFDLIPAPVQYGTALYVGKLLDDLGRDLAITSETAGRGSYSVDPGRRPEMPPEAIAALAPFRTIRT